MQPLFNAVAHGCAADLHQQALEEVYYPRIQRDGITNFLSSKLGAFSDDLAVVTHFFTAPWHTPAAGLGENEQAGVLNWAGFRLRAMGRLREALQPMQANVDMSVQQENWIEAALGASNLSELQLDLGNVAAAVASGQQSVSYADQSEDGFQRMGKRSTHADALHQAGEKAQALERFIEAEQIQQEQQPENPRLYSLAGFRYCNLLLKQDTIAVLERAEYALALSEKYLGKGLGLHDIALDKLTLGRAHYLQGDFPQAIDRLDQAVTGLRQAGTRHHLPRGLLARAALNCDTHNPNHDFTHARQDLQEVYDIAEPSSMRLHLTDYHLEMARLLLAEREGGVKSPEEVDGRKALTLDEHVAEAARLIDATGYNRRLPELQELQRQLDLPVS
ncbi:MAG: hypothetical protein KDF59_05625 [Nitrosomonas sp.]|nr:hypothetical protein [Nitrosomonas sp.]